ncbi:MAG TPA: hypothetical protein VK912_05740 [Longimicrobiales bacterium]|nr:hypothetical protein [Longimicrobiales bacterium]
MRKLIAALAMLSLIASGSLRAGASADGRSSITPASETVSATAIHAVQHALPGHAALHGLATSIVPSGPAGADAWRNPGGQRVQTHPARSHEHTSEARTHIGSAQRARLAFVLVVARAHANRPGTFGNPPPPLLT